MDLNLLVRGQSNSIALMEAGNNAGRAAITREVERLLGFDGVNDRVRLIYDSEDLNGSTSFAGTALIGDWLAPRNGDWHQGWTVQGLEQALLNEIGNLPAGRRDDPTAVLWLHNEFDAWRADLTPEEWISAVRFDAQQVRAALGGQGAATTPYLFVSAMPFPSTDAGHDAIRRGMEWLAGDPAFNAQIAARMLDIDADGDEAGSYGGNHIDAEDAMQTVLRSARAVAEAFAAYAKPGSPVAQAGGNIADEGPQVVTAAIVAPNQLRLDVRHDHAGGFGALDADAAQGIGWLVSGVGGTVWGTRVSILDRDSLLVTFSGAIPEGGVLTYGRGYGRLAGADGSGRGNAIYDDQGLPIWVSADGLGVTADGGPAGKVLSGGTGPDTLRGGARADSLSGAGGNDSLLGAGGADTLLGGDGRDTLRGGAGDDRLLGDEGADLLRGDKGHDRITTGSGADRVTFAAGDGQDTVTDFLIGTDRLSLVGIATGDVTAELATIAGVSGLLLRMPGGDSLFLQGLGQATARQLGLSGQFAEPTATQVVGTAGNDALAGTAGADSISGGAGADDLRGLGGNDTIRGGTGDDGMIGSGGADLFVFARGDGEDWVEDFQTGIDKVRLEGVAAAEVTQVFETRWSYSGIALHYGNDEVFLAGATASLGAGDLILG